MRGLLGRMFKYLGYHITNLGCYIEDGMSLDELYIAQQINEWFDVGGG